MNKTDEAKIFWSLWQVLDLAGKLLWEFYEDQFIQLYIDEENEKLREHLLKQDPSL